MVEEEENRGDLCRVRMRGRITLRNLLLEKSQVKKKAKTTGHVADGRIDRRDAIGSGNCKGKRRGYMNRIRLSEGQ